MRSAHPSMWNIGYIVTCLMHRRRQNLLVNCRVLLVVIMKPAPDTDMVVAGADIAKVGGRMILESVSLTFPS